MATYMKIDGIKGSATANGYDGWIEINTIDQAVNYGIQS